MDPRICGWNKRNNKIVRSQREQSDVQKCLQSLRLLIEPIFYPKLTIIIFINVLRHLWTSGEERNIKQEERREGVSTRKEEYLLGNTLEYLFLCFTST